MADFVKRVSDDRINVKLILCGIALSISGLTGDHPSSERAFSPIHLRQLPYDNLQEIILAAADAFPVIIPSGCAQRISVISDGFPYFAQLIGEQLFGSFLKILRWFQPVTRSTFKMLLIDRLKKQISPCERNTTVQL